MIQRIQTLYLVLAGLFPAFTFYVPIVSFSFDAPATAASASFMCSLGYSGLEATEIAGRHPYGLMVFAALGILIAWASIFGYKNRKKQIRTVNLALTSLFIWYISFFAYTYSVMEKLQATVGFEVGCLLPLVSILLLFLARKAIRHDEALVRAADRIR